MRRSHGGTMVYVRFGLRQQELTHHGDASDDASVHFLLRQRLWRCWFVGNRARCDPQSRCMKFERSRCLYKEQFDHGQSVLQ